MRNWFLNRPTRTKLLGGFGALIALVAAVSLVGYLDLRETKASLDQMHDEQMAVAVALGEMGSKLNAVRASLLTMFLVKDRTRQQQEHVRIQELTKAIDASFVDLMAAPLPDATRAKLQHVRAPWEAFRDTRDTQLIPAIYDGRLAEAQALAGGIQAERYRAFSAGADELIADARRQASASRAQAARNYRNAVALFLGLSGLAVLVGIGLTVLFTRWIARPLVAVVGALEQVAAGDLTVTVAARSRDEVGRVAEATRHLVNVQRQVFGQVQSSAQMLAAASEQLAAAAEELSSGAQEQAAAVEETAASLEEMTSTVEHTADHARDANRLALVSRDTADKAGGVVRDAVAAMAEIDGASRQITDIIDTINDIAFQTNLLALNAAVEAARAGEQGRGFAVVAAEVRNLAQRCAAAAKEIRALIKDSVAKVENGSELVQRSGQGLDEIVSAARRVTDRMQEIAAGTTEQSSGLAQVNRAVAQMDTVIQHNASQTEELSATAQSLAQQAQELQAIVGRFRLPAEVEKQAVAPLRRTAQSEPWPAPSVRHRAKGPGKPASPPKEPAPAPALSENTASPGPAGFEEF